jgi:hypothetical protein
MLAIPMSQQECLALDQIHHGSAVPPELPQQIEAQIQGEISGQVTVGSNIVQLGSVHGGVVHINSSSDQPMAKPRALPVLLRPRPFLNLIGREQEVGTIVALLKAATPTEICGPEGIGKTSLLRYLSHRPEVSLLFPDGVVYLAARSKPVSDLLQSLYDAFYDSGATVKPTEAQITHDLQDKRALIVLDDVKLTRDDLEEMMDVVSGSTFLFSAEEQLLWSEGESIALAGLGTIKAIALIENKLGRSLSSEEKAAAETLCHLLAGHPLKLLQCLGQVKQRLQSLEEIVRQYRSNACELDAYTESDRQVLAVLSTVGQAGLQAQQVAEITGLPDAPAVLQGLHQQDRVQLEGDRYSIKESEATLLASQWNLHPDFQNVLAYFIQFAEHHKKQPDCIHREAEALLKLLQMAAEAELWTEVLSLGQSIENAFALKKQWGAWENILQLGLQAARETGQKAAEALMLHQIGTRAVCIGEQEVAQQALSQAIEIRESMGDRIGAAISRHNLQTLLFIIATATTAAAAAVVVSASSASAGIGSAAVGTVGAAGATVAAGAAATGVGLTPFLIGGAGAALLTTGIIVNQQTNFLGRTTQRDAISRPFTNAQQSDPAPAPFEELVRNLTPPVSRLRLDDNFSSAPIDDGNPESADPIAEASAPAATAPAGPSVPQRTVRDRRDSVATSSRSPRSPAPATVPPAETAAPSESGPSLAPTNDDDSDRANPTSQPNRRTAPSDSSGANPPTPPIQVTPADPPAGVATPAASILPGEPSSTGQTGSILGTQFGSLHEARTYFREERGE